VPSGVDASTGRVDGDAVRADVTVTFGTVKPGLLVDPGASYAGVVELVDIGLGPDLREPDVVALQAADVASLRPPQAPETDKYRRGVLGVVGGSERFTGAPVLTVGGALTGGVGMVRFVSTRRPVELVRQRWPEVVTTVVEPGDADGVLGAGRVQAWAVGPGMGTGDGAAAVLRAVLSADAPVVVDADGLTLLAGHRAWLSGRAAPTVLTPHAGELTRLVGGERADVEARRLEHATRAAEELGVTVLLKGSTTLVAQPGRPARVNPTGTADLATAGSGDVLTGLIGAFLATGMDPLDAASAGAYVHGHAARVAADGAPISASDVVEAVPEAFRALAQR
ncbi:MAG: NAD(P)H-hydrate dehydratase, partial [Streptosporangiaceae bacterium]